MFECIFLLHIRYFQNLNKVFVCGTLQSFKSDVKYDVKLTVVLKSVLKLHQMFHDSFIHGHVASRFEGVQQLLFHVVGVAVKFQAYGTPFLKKHSFLLCFDTPCPIIPTKHKDRLIPS